MDTKRSQTVSPKDYCSSPEFEFWMVRNPSFPQPNILSADQLFVNGVLLPLHLLSKPDPPPKTPHPGPDPPSSAPDPEPEPSPAITAESSATSASKRWKDIFRKSDKKNNNNAEENEKDKDKDKGKKKEKKSGATPSAELNINIWPFSRSRSAGNAGTRPKLFPGAPVTRRVNSAPCSRSNSAGESKSRKWPSSPGRAGVHLGRNSPVWQVRRGPENHNHKWPKIKREINPSNRRSKAVSSSDGSAKGRVLNLNVPMCIACRNHLSCRSDDNSAIGDSDIRRSNRGGGHAKLFNLRSLFSKKSLVTSH